MFKKIVSQLSFSPALVGQLSFYAKRLKREQATRRLGLIFVALALVVQSLVVFQAPESANAANPLDMIPGGLGIGSSRSLNNFVGPYDRNERNLQDVMNYFGISRNEITSAQFGSFRVGNKISWGYENRAGSTTVPITNGAGTHVNTLYGRPLQMNNPVNDQIYGYIGHSNKIGWFAIMQVCGNLVTDIYPSPPPPPPPPPAPANITTSKSAVNVSQGGVDATKATAKANDKLTFTLNAKNTGGTAKNVDFSDNLTSTLKFASLTDKGGGTFNESSNVLSWPTVSVGPGATVTKTFSVQITTSLVSSETNCKIVNTFNNDSVTIPVGCTPPPANIVTSKTAKNVTQGNIDAATTIAKVNDKLTFTLTAKNTGGTATTVDFKDNLTSTLTYAKLTDKGGGAFDTDTRVLSWPSESVAPGQTVTKKFSVQMNSSLQAATLNCRLINTFTNSTVTVPVGCTLPPAEIVLSKSAKNVSQGNIDATTATAKEKDRITFTLTAQNKGGSPKDVTFADMLGDTLEYSTLTDNGGGTYDKTTRTLSWPTISLKAGETEIRTFTVQILAQIPATPAGQSDPSSYDCRIENVFGNDVIIKVTCPAPKVIEQVVPELPHTGPRENMIFAGIVLSIVTFFYFRSRQLGTEVRLIRRDLNGGSI